MGVEHKQFTEKNPNALQDNKSYSISLLIRKLQFKTTLRFQFCLSYWQGTESLMTCHIIKTWRFGSCLTNTTVNDTASREDNWTVGVKIKITYLTLKFHFQKRILQINLCLQNDTVTRSFFTNCSKSRGAGKGGNVEQIKLPLVESALNIFWSIYIMESQAAFKRMKQNNNKGMKQFYMYQHGTLFKIHQQVKKKKSK